MAFSLAVYHFSFFSCPLCYLRSLLCGLDKQHLLKGFWKQIKLHWRTQKTTRFKRNTKTFQCHHCIFKQSRKCNITFQKETWCTCAMKLFYRVLWKLFKFLSERLTLSCGFFFSAISFILGHVTVAHWPLTQYPCLRQIGLQLPAWMLM